MNRTRCHFCGMETSAAYCPRCKARLAPQTTQASYARAGGVGGGAGGRALRRLVALAVIAAVCVGAYSLRYRIWYGPDAVYALAIRDAEQFKAPLTLTVKKSVGAPQWGGVQVAGVLPATDPVYVLEARGLVQFGSVSTDERSAGTLTSAPPSGSFGAPTQVALTQRYDSTTAVVTPQGRQEAAAWTDTGGAWRVPIGTREVYRIEKVGEPTAAAGVETREVEFSWRWSPNTVGEAFDTDGKVFPTLNERARTAAEVLRWGSANAYRAVARLERRAGGDWRVAEIRKSENFDRRKELSAF